MSNQSNQSNAFAFALKKQHTDGSGESKLIHVGNAVLNANAKYQPAYNLVGAEGDGIGLILDPTKDGNFVLKKVTPSGEEGVPAKYDGICVMFKSLSKGGNVYYRGKNKETGEVYRMFLNDRAA